MYLEKSRRRRLRIGVALCRTYAPMALGLSHGISTLQQSVAEPLEKFCNHWHQGTVAAAATTFGRRGLSLWWGHERVFSRVYGVGSRGHRCILVTAVTVRTRTRGRA